MRYIHDFEQTALVLAAQQGYDRVVCGHIHQPRLQAVCVADKTVHYANSGDWVEHLTALEWTETEWKLFDFYESIRSSQLAPVSSGSTEDEFIEVLSFFIR